MTSKPRYTGLGIALGTGLGAAAGVLLGHMAAWLGLGIAIGMVIGATFRRKETECSECAAMHRAHELRKQQVNPPEGLARSQKLEAGS